MDARTDKVALGAALATLTEYWSQQTVGEANGSLFKIAKGTGSTTWHSHDDQDEVFLLMSGSLVIQLRGRDVTLAPGELFIIPRGVEHCPRADEEARFLIVGTSITSNTAGGKPEWSEGGGLPQ